MNFENLGSQNEIAIKAAGPRYTPGIDPAAPNIEIGHLVGAVNALSIADGYLSKVSGLVSELDEALRTTRGTVDSVFERRKITPAVIRHDLDQLLSIKRPGLIRKQVLMLRRRTKLVLGALEQESKHIFGERRQLGDDKVHDQERRRLDSGQEYVRRLQSAVSSADRYFNDVTGELLVDTPCLLLLGFWGTGKTHFMCDLARHMLSDGSPVLLVLASSLDPSIDPLDAIAKSTRLARSGNNLLRGLDRLGAKAGRRALLLVDGINEGDRVAWRKALSSLSQRVRKFENVGIVLTCRRPYEELLLKSDDAKGYVQMEHFGFEDREFDAQLEYFSHYGLSAPDVPLIAPEFSRPLFLKILCEAIAGLAAGSRNRKLRDIASGQKGMTYVLEYFVARVGKAIEQDFGLPGKACWRLLKGTSQTNPGIAGIMAANSRDWVTPDQTVGSIRHDLGCTEDQAKSLLSRLIDDGLLSEDLRWRENSLVDVIVFPYQRFSDHLIARHMLESHLDTRSETTIRRSLYVNQPLGALFALDRWSREYESPGLAAALMLEFPERVKRTNYVRELIWFLPKCRRLVTPMKNAFLEGLYWRGKDAFTTDTDYLINFLLGIGGDVRDETLEVLVGLAARPGHAYAAGRLHGYLSQQAMTERDLIWSEFVRHSHDQSAVYRVLAWAEQTADKRVDSEVAQNEILLLSLVLTTTDRKLRDRVTRAIVKLGIRHPAALFEVVLQSLDFDDPYVSERTLAAAYGVTMRLWAAPSGKELRKRITPFARELVRRMFLPGAPHATTHVLRRDYAVGIIELCRMIDPHSIATRHVHYIRAPRLHIPSPFTPPNRITARDISDVEYVLNTDFENYTIGQLTPDRGNYDSAHVEHRQIRRQILHRIKTLGYTSEQFKEIDDQIGRYNWRQEDAGKEDRYGKKYSWIAFFEMYGLRVDKGLLADHHTDRRTSDCDIDPSFPEPVPEWQPELPDPFKDAPLAEHKWLRSGRSPDFESLLLRDDVDGIPGPWVLLDAYVDQAGTRKREVFTFIRGLLARESEIERLQKLVDNGGYLRNNRLPQPGADYYTFAGEIPWSENFGAGTRLASGKARRHRESTYLWHDSDAWRSSLFVEVPVHNWNWESSHSDLNEVSGIKVPAPALCEALELVGHDASFDLFDQAGRRASMYRAWPAGNKSYFTSHALYLREDLLRRYLAITHQQFFWIPWGERGLYWKDFERPRSKAIRSAMQENAHMHGRLVRWSPSSAD